MDLGASFVPHVESPEAMQPGQGALHDPATDAEATAVRRAAAREDRDDALRAQPIAVRLGVIAAVPLKRVRLATRTAAAAANGRQRGDEWVELRDVIDVRGGHLRDEWDPASLRDDVVFRARLTAIGWVRSSFFPPRSARREPLSTTAQLKSRRPRRRNSASSTSCSCCHTPARCQATSRRQQVLPDPQPISRGNICHGNPACSTKRMPVNAARSETRGRPMRRPRRCRSRGSRGSIRVHNRSSRRGRDMPDRTKPRIAVQEACQ